MSPIRASERGRYPANWKAISLSIRQDRAKWCCECRGQCGREHPFADSRCLMVQGGELFSGAKVVLTVAHLNHAPEDCRPENLLAMCQACHLRYDARHHAETARATRRQRKTDAGQQELFA